MASATIGIAYDRLVGDIVSAFDEVQLKGGTVPSSKVSANLAAAIRSISTGVTVFGAIVVDFPAGSTCTCSNGSLTYTAGSTGGNWVFTVPSAGTWTVTATGDGETVSESISITTQGQGAYIELEFTFYVLKNGVLKNGFLCEKTTGGNLDKGCTLTFKDGYAALVMPAVCTGGLCFGPLSFPSSFSTLYCDTEFTSNHNTSWSRPSISSNKTWYNKNITTSVIVDGGQKSGLVARSTKSFDVSTVNQTAYFKYNAYSEVAAELRIYNVWLE